MTGSQLGDQRAMTLQNSISEAPISSQTDCICFSLPLSLSLSDAIYLRASVSVCVCRNPLVEHWSAGRQCFTADRQSCLAWNFLMFAKCRKIKTILCAQKATKTKFPTRKKLCEDLIRTLQCCGQGFGCAPLTTWVWLSAWVRRFWERYLRHCALNM